MDVSAACPMLTAWDGRYTTDSRGALLFARFWDKVSTTTGAERWRAPFDLADPLTTPDGLDTTNPVVRRAFGDAVAELWQAGIPMDAPLGEY